MRLNALHPEDNPMEALLFCFGGDGGGDSGGADTQDSQMDELDQISADFDNMDSQISAGESVTSGMDGGVGRGGDSNDNDGDGIPNSIDATPGVDRSTIGAEQDAFDLSASYLDDAITDFQAGPETDGRDNYVEMAQEVDMPPADQSMTAGYPTEELQAGVGDYVISSLLGDAEVPPDQISDIYSSLLNTAKTAEQMYSPAQPNYVEYDYPSYQTPQQQIGSAYDPGFYDDDTGDTGLSGFISQAFDQDNLAVKNNNPGNLKFRGQPGATEDERGFAKFENPQDGMNALVNQINLDRSRGDTLEGFINDYAPPSENATQNYIDYVSQQTGIAPGEQIPEDKVAAVAGAITQMEGGNLSTDYFSSAQSIYDTMEGDTGGITVEFVDEGTTDYRDTFVAQDRIGTGVPVTSLPEGSYQLDPETNTVALNDVGREYMDELAKGYNDLPNKFGIDRQEIDSLMQQGELVGAPMVQVPTSSVGFAGAPEGGEAPAGEGEDEAGLAGGMGGAGRLGDDEVAQEGAEEFAYDYPAFFPSETGDQSQQAQSTSGLGISDESGGVGLIPGEGGVIGTDTGLIGQRGSGSINPFTEGGGGGEGAEESVIPGQGEGQTGTEEGAGDGTGTGTPPTVADGGDGGGDTTVPPVVEEPVIPYFFGEPMEFYDPNLPPFEYRTPLVTTPYDFARDFGSYTLSEPIAESYAQRALIAPEGLIPYTPEYMEPIAEMDELRQAELLSLIGERFPGEFGEFDYDMSVSPLESAQALIDALGNQSS
jgi:hypothetical protein